jgi:hypothetical protein
MEEAWGRKRNRKKLIERKGTQLAHSVKRKKRKDYLIRGLLISMLIRSAMLSLSLCSSTCSIPASQNDVPLKSMLSTLIFLIIIVSSGWMH